MTRLVTILKTLAPIVASVVTALTPFYGKYHWFVAAVAAVSAITLAAPSVLPPGQSTAGK